MIIFQLRRQPCVYQFLIVPKSIGDVIRASRAARGERNHHQPHTSQWTDGSACISIVPYNVHLKDQQPFATNYLHLGHRLQYCTASSPLKCSAIFILGIGLLVSVGFSNNEWRIFPSSLTSNVV